MKQFNLNIDEILQPQDWGFPVPIAYGPGRVKEISSFCKNLNIHNPLIVTDSGSKDLPFIENLIKVLMPRQVIKRRRFSQVRSPTINISSV